MGKAQVILPWPSKALSPNGSHGHWSKKYKATKAAKEAAFYFARQQGIVKINAQALTVRYTFHPPNRQRRDADNLIASCKALNDAISMATGVDDSKWSLIISPMGEVVKGGRVVLDLEWNE